MVYGVSSTACDHSGEPPLVLAARSGNLPGTRALLAAGANVIASVNPLCVNNSKMMIEWGSFLDFGDFGAFPTLAPHRGCVSGEYTDLNGTSLGRGCMAVAEPGTCCCMPVVARLLLHACRWAVVGCLVHAYCVAVGRYQTAVHVAIARGLDEVRGKRKGKMVCVRVRGCSGAGVRADGGGNVKRKRQDKMPRGRHVLLRR